MDCIAVGQSGDLNDDTVEKVKLAEQYGYKNASYIGLYAGWDQIYDEYNDRRIFVPKAIYGATLFARTDRVGKTWQAPSGTERGILDSLGQNKTFKFTEIGTLQDSGINTSRWLKTYGHVMWGQKTAQVKASALDRISTRRLLIFVESSVEQFLFPFCFNIVNDDKSRLRIESGINTFFDGLKGGDAPGLRRESKAVCNDKNNTNEIINASQMLVDLFIIPSLPVEVIRVRALVVKSGVTFEELAA
jgi:phage tail sheath protein FI